MDFAGSGVLESLPEARVDREEAEEDMEHASEGWDNDEVGGSSKTSTWLVLFW